MDIKRETSQYGGWMINEYNGKFGVVNYWQNSEGTKTGIQFVTIKKYDGSEQMIPGGLTGQFNSMGELVNELKGFIQQIEDAMDGKVPGPSIPDDDVPF